MKDVQKRLLRSTLLLVIVLAASVYLVTREASFFTVVLLGTVILLLLGNLSVIAFLMAVKRGVKITQGENRTLLTEAAEAAPEQADQLIFLRHRGEGVPVYSLIQYGKEGVSLRAVDKGFEVLAEVVDEFVELREGDRVYVSLRKLRESFSS